MNKYHSRKTTVDGITFDSKAEAARYQELRILFRAGIIRELKLQPEYELIPAFKKNGVTYRRTVYRADFSYYDTVSGRFVIEDVKGVRTELYRLKKKLFEYKYPDLEIKEIP